jgi:hypothetical protein
MQNYNMIVTQIQLRCKLNIFHIKTSKIKKDTSSTLYICIYFMSFLHFEAHEFCIDTLFYAYFIEIS